MADPGLFVKDDGNPLYAADVNLILRPLSPMDITDNTIQTSNSTSYATFRTLDVAAGVISSFVYIRFNLRAYSAAGGYGSTGNTTAYVQITIDGVQKFERTLTAHEFRSNTSTGDYRDTSTGSGAAYSALVFKYEPTSDEKTNGFTIDLDLKRTVTESGRAMNDSWEVWGV